MCVPKVPYFLTVRTPTPPPEDDVSDLYDEDAIAYSRYFDSMMAELEIENKMLREEIKLYELDERGDISLYY